MRIGRLANYDAQVRISARRHGLPSGDLQWSARLPGGFRFLISGSDGRPIQPAFDFLSRTYLKGRQRLRMVGANKSIEAAAYDLCDFHDYLDALQIPVDDVDEVVLEGYLASMINVPSLTTGRPYAAETIQRRRSSVWAFITYCQNHGRLKNRFSTTTISTPQGRIDSVAADIAGPSVGPMDRHVRALHPQVVKGLLDATGTALIDISEGGDIVATGVLIRQRMMSEACVQTGIRRAECCGLKRAVVMAADIERRPKFGTVAIPVLGKGSKTRQVPFPVWLLERMQAYVREVRDPMVAEAIKKGWIPEDHGHLFVLSTGRSDAFGRMVLPAQFAREFADARKRLSLGQKNSADAVLSERVARSRLSIHALRHTFALLTYIKRRQQGDADPSKYVQAVLGHVFRHTTEALYLNASHIYESELSDEYEELLLKFAQARKRHQSASKHADGEDRGSTHG